MAEDRKPPLLDLEASLIADNDAVRRNEILDRLTRDAREVKSKLDRGLAPDDAAAAQRLLEALYASHQVVRAVWRYHHAA